MPAKYSKVLIVEDDPALLLSLATSFKSLGCEVLGAKNGEEALEIVSRQKVTAVLCDIQMPKMTGVQLLKALRERDIEVPVIMMTGFSELQEDEIGNLGGVVTLKKPFSREQIKELVDDYINLLEV